MGPWTRLWVSKSFGSTGLKVPGYQANFWAQEKKLNSKYQNAHPRNKRHAKVLTLTVTIHTHTTQCMTSGHYIFIRQQSGLFQLCFPFLICSSWAGTCELWYTWCSNSNVSPVGGFLYIKHYEPHWTHMEQRGFVPEEKLTNPKPSRLHAALQQSAHCTGVMQQASVEQQAHAASLHRQGSTKAVFSPKTTSITSNNWAFRT